jgi:hypothetical protein
MRNPPSPRILLPLLRDPPNLESVDCPLSLAAVKAAAEFHGMAPTVANIIKHRLSAEDRQWCDHVLVRSWRRHDESLRRVDFLVGLLDAAGVDTLVLKGAVLARRHYPIPFLRRPSFDVDLAVRDREIEAAVEALEHHGYSLKFSVEEARRCSHHVNMRHPEKGEVELHFRLCNAAAGIPVDRFMESSIPYQLPTGHTVAILRPEDELLHLLLHFSSGGFGSFFHSFELRQLWKAAPPEYRVAAIDAAISGGFAWAVHLADLAFQDWWSERLIPQDKLVPATWLQWRIGPKLLRELEQQAWLGRDLTFTDRIKGRVLDMHLADTAFDALKFVVVRQFWRRLYHARDILLGLTQAT